MQSKHGTLESAILNILWTLEEEGGYKNTVKDVFLIFNKNERNKRAYTTIKTVMDRLHEKKQLIRFKDGKKFCYKTVYSNKDTVMKSLDDICNRYCGGDFKKLSAVVNIMANTNCLAGV